MSNLHPEEESVPRTHSPKTDSIAAVKSQRCDEQDIRSEKTLAASRSQSWQGMSE